MQPEVLRVVEITNAPFSSINGNWIPLHAETMVRLQPSCSEFIAGAQVILFFAHKKVPFEFGKSYTLNLTPVDESA